jgi:hypothetical protein
MKPGNRLKASVNAWLSKMAAVNRQIYGEGPLDCCKTEKRAPSKSAVRPSRDKQGEQWR